MEENMLILGQNQYYSLDCHKTKLNNNVLVVGTSGAGKTRSIVTPNLLQANGSYILSDPKGNLYSQYGPFLEKKGYIVKKLDFTDPVHSAHYNFFRYIRNTQDIVKIAHMLMYQRQDHSHADPFWDESGQLLLQAIMAYLMEAWGPNDQNLHTILKLINICTINENDTEAATPLDRMMKDWGEKSPGSYALSTYNKVRISAARTMKSILVTVNAKLGMLDTPEMNELMREDDVDIASIGKQKTALFVVVSDTDRSVDNLANIFFTQAMNELCRVADKECKDHCLPVPVRFILDDFATNCKIEEFPRMISAIRSRGISTMLMIQAESQLTQNYGYDAQTIIGNCDSYVYLGGNDVETARAVAERCDMPLRKILNMPVGTSWIFRRGQAPINAENFELEPFLIEKKLIIRDRLYVKINNNNKIKLSTCLAREKGD